MTDLPLYANIILTLVGVAIAAGNAFVCFAFYTNKKIRTMTNHFVISLAVSDFLVGSVLAPLSAWYSSKGPALGPLIAFTLIGSLSNISGCTYDRYVAIQHPLRYQAILTKSKLHKILVLIWVVPGVISFVPQIWLSFGDNLGLSQSVSIKINRAYVGCMAFGVLAVCIAMIGIYATIFKVARRHFAAISYLSTFNQPQQDDHGDGATRTAPGRRMRRFSLKSLVKDVKATKLFAIIATTFVLCWLPLIIINITDSLGYQEKLPMAFVNVALFTIFGNSLVNPIIYAFFQPSFRQTIVSWFRCRCCRRCRRRRNSDHLLELKIASLRKVAESSSFKCNHSGENSKKENSQRKRESTYELEPRQQDEKPRRDNDDSSEILETSTTKWGNQCERLLSCNAVITNGGPSCLAEVRL
eukprot:gene11787-13007_t